MGFGSYDESEDSTDTDFSETGVDDEKPPESEHDGEVQQEDETVEEMLDHLTDE